MSAQHKQTTKYRVSKGVFEYSIDNVFVVILFAYRTYIDGIFIAYRRYVNGIILSYRISYY